ncbi:MAG: hypothetical protein ABR567_16205 [Myxococcales bacterium]
MPLSTEDQQRFIRDVREKVGDVAGAQGRQWVREANAYTVKLASERRSATPETRTTFWIRVCGVFAEVHNKVVSNRDFAVKWTSEPAQSAADAALKTEFRGYIEPLNRLVNAISDAKGTLSPDEMLYLLYRRDVECHPWQDAYRIRVQKDRLIDTRNVFGTAWKIEDLDAALKRTLLKFSVNEGAIAAAFAEWLVAPMGRVLEASERWYGAAG